MKILNKSESGVIYQIEREFEGIGPAIIDICYSGNVNENGEETLKFVYASIDDEVNDKLSIEQILHLNKEIENGLEEALLLFLINEYRRNHIPWVFDLGEYNDHTYLLNEVSTLKTRKYENDNL